MANTLKWLGQSGWLLETGGGATILIDAWLSKNPLAPMKIEELPGADFFFLTHDHSDHASDAVAITKHTGATLVAQPETVKRYSQDGAPKVIGMNIGGTVDAKGVKATMVDAYHSSETGTPAGYIFTLEDGKVLYHAGDTAINANMALWGELFAMDVALLPIGGHYTMDGAQAARALRMLRPKMALPMHYRTFPALAQTADDFVNGAREHAPRTTIKVIEPGEAITF